MCDGHTKLWSNSKMGGQNSVFIMFLCLHVETKRGRWESTGHSNVEIVLIFCQISCVSCLLTCSLLWTHTILLLGITEISSQTKTASMCTSWCIHLTELLPRRLANSWTNACLCQMKRQLQVFERSEERNGCPTLLSYGIWCSSSLSQRYSVVLLNCKNKFTDGSQDSKLLLHASHVALVSWIS